MQEDMLLTDAKLQAAFKLFDKDNSGSISAEEVKVVLGDSIDQNQVDEAIKEVDKNEDGEGKEFNIIAAIQFVRWLNRQKDLL